MVATTQCVPDRQRDRRVVTQVGWIQIDSYLAPTLRTCLKMAMFLDFQLAYGKLWLTAMADLARFLLDAHTKDPPTDLANLCIKTTCSMASHTQMYRALSLEMHTTREAATTCRFDC